MQTVFSPDTISNAVKIVSGQHTTVAAADDIEIPALRTILAASATLVADPTADPFTVTATYTGNTLTLKSWKTATNPAAATTFSKRVDYVVVGV